MSGFGGVYVGPNPIKRYGCVKCQTTHYEDEPVYTKHLIFQSKHGVETGKDWRQITPSPRA